MGQDHTLRAIQERVIMLQADVVTVQELRRRIEQLAANRDLFVTEQSQIGDPLSVLASLTEYLPDDTFISALVMRGGRLSFDGQSRGAAKLIELLSNAGPIFRDVSFLAPVRRDHRGIESFSIGLLVGQKDDAP